ncbi:MAG: NAD(P)H-hydrate dehydratase [Sphingomonadales bacterium]|nr:NAD(P)H-hydrate dehydratase [Sphingomonadales bacterium]
MDPGLKIITFSESKECDALTIKNEGMRAHDLMDRATLRIFQRLLCLIPNNKSITVLCGPGNNGADGLCLASMLAVKGYDVETKICLLDKTPSASLTFRLSLYSQQQSVNIQITEDAKALVISKNRIIVDALFGTGLQQPLQHKWQALIDTINNSGCEVFSIDMPSGLLDNSDSMNMPFINAKKVLTIQCPKPSLLYPEFKIDFEVLDCGIETETIITNHYFLNYPDSQVKKQMALILPRRPKHSHKGTFGHTLLIGGNSGMHGAIAMAAKSCYESGSGLTTVLSPEGTLPFLSATPEIMHIPHKLNEEAISTLPLDKFKSIALGPGLGNTPETCRLMADALKRFRIPLILDADALNIIASRTELLNIIPEGSLLTPHPAEFERLFGHTKSGKQKEDIAVQKSQELGVYILAKNTYSLLACPDGKVFYNGTGDSKLARGGSGDKLTGIIAGLFAQNQNMRDAALAGMYYSGLGRLVI